MANDREIVIKISADGTAAIEGMRQVGDETGKFGSRTTSFLDQAKQNWVAYTAVIYATGVAINKAMAYAELGAKALQAAESFRIVAASANDSADKIISGMKRAAQGTVDDSDIMQKAVKGMVLGLKGDEMVKIMEAARVSARVAGEDVKTAYEGITDAIVSVMPRALRKYGIASMEEMALVEKAMAVGVHGIKLYDIAMLNAGIQAEKMGQMHKNAAENIQAFHAQVNQTRETIGKAVIAVEGYLLAGLTGLAAFIVRAAQGMATVLSILPGSIGEAAKNAQSILGGVSADLMKDRAKLLGIVTAEERKAAEEATSGAAARIAAAEKEKAAWIANLKAQIEAAKGGKGDPAMERRLREVAKMYADEGKIVHDALMYEMGMTQEYHDTLRKLSDEEWAEEKKIAAAIVQLDAKRYAEEGSIAMEALAAEMGMDELYYSTLRKLSDDDFENFKSKLRDKAELEVKYQDERIRLQEGMRAQAIAGAGDVPGGEGITGGLFDLYSLADGTDPFSMQLERARLFWGQMKTLQGQGLATIEEMEAAHANYKVMLDNQTNMMRLQEGLAYLNIMQGVLGAVASFSSGKSREMFLVSRAVAVAMAIVQAHVAAIASYAALAGIPIVGPALGAAAASKALTFGYINAALIAATAIGQASQMGGASMGSLGGNVGGGGVPSLAVQGSAAPEQAARPASPVVNVHIYNSGYMGAEADVLARDLVPYITKAVSDGVR